MAHLFINGLKEGDALQQFFLLRQVETRLTKAGKPFLNLVLGDRSGVIKARVWDEVLEKCPGPFKPGDYVGVSGLVSSYQNELQVVVKYINTVDSLRALGRQLPDFDPDLLQLSTSYDRQALWQELWLLASESLKPPLGELVQALLTKYKDDLLVCPAARRNHHAYLGGLLEHTCTVARHARQSLTVYRDLHADLVLAGAILHDLGKIKELANPVVPEITVPGQLMGHVVLGWEMVREQAREMSFPTPQLLMELEHIILSHHGSLEFGSPVIPKTREALLVFYLDDLDAKLKMMGQHLEADLGDGQFTSYHRVLQRDLYKAPERQAEGAALQPDEDS